MPDLERIQQNTPGTLSQQWYEDGAPVDPGTVTVGITRADGTTLVAGGASTTGTGTAARTYNLTTTHTALLDRLKVTWTSATKGTLVSYVEVVGGFLFSISQAKALRELASQPAATVAEYRTLVETELEDACAQAFVPRYELETLNGSGADSLVLKWPNVRAIRSVTVDDAVYTSGQIAELAFNPSGIVTNTGIWSAGASNIVIGYEHGLSAPPPGGTRVGLLLIKAWLGGVNRPIDDRAITFSSNEAGTYSLAVPGRNGSTFGMPDVDAWVDRHNMRIGVA